MEQLSTPMDSIPDDTFSFEAVDVWIDNYPSATDNREPIEASTCRNEPATSSSEDERDVHFDLENLDPDSEAFRNHQAQHRGLRHTSMKRPVATLDSAADAVHGDRSRGAPRRKVKSPLPDNYPRIPLHDITAVLYADSNVTDIPANRFKKSSAGTDGKMPPGTNRMPDGDNKATGGALDCRYLSTGYHSTGSAGEFSQQQPVSMKGGERKMMGGYNGRPQSRPQGSRSVLAMR